MCFSHLRPLFCVRFLSTKIYTDMANFPLQQDILATINSKGSINWKGGRDRAKKWLAPTQAQQPSIIYHLHLPSLLIFQNFHTFISISSLKCNQQPITNHNSYIHLLILHSTAIILAIFQPNFFAMIFELINNK
jgi:hypothetical protein